MHHTLLPIDGSIIEWMFQASHDKQMYYELIIFLLSTFLLLLFTLLTYKCILQNVDVYKKTAKW